MSTDQPVQGTAVSHAVSHDLEIAPDLSLPIAIAGEAIGVLATRGAGKSYTSAVLVEELHGAGVQLVVLDPTGVYWGLRSSADGKSEGLPLFVLGGAHGDVPLEPTAGKLIADVIVDTGQSIILDLSDFDTKAAQTRFVADLLERLYHRKARNRSTLHLIVDEANEFAPQSGGRHGGDMPRLLGAMERAVGKGRSRGLAFTLITQRSAALNKNVLDLIDTLIAMRVLGPRDRSAIASWITDKQESDEGGIVDSLPKLPTGTAWVWSPVRGILQKVAIRRIRTFDSYRTPEPGEVRTEPTARAPLDVSALGDQIRATAERAKADDPRELRKQVADLQRQLNDRPAEQVVETVTERVEVPVLNGQVGELRDIVRELVGFGQSIVDVGDRIVAAIARVEATPAPVRPAARPTPTQSAPPRRASAAVVERPPMDGRTLGKAERSILSVLAQYPQGRSKRQVALAAGYAINGGGFNNAIGALRSAGYVKGSKELLAATDAGMEAIAGQVEPLPTGPALLAHWLSHPRLGKAERLILEHLYHLGGAIASKDEVAAATGYAAEGGGFNNALGRLRTLELVTGGRDDLRASEDLF